MMERLQSVTTSRPMRVLGSDGVGDLLRVTVLVAALNHTGFWWGALFGAVLLTLVIGLSDRYSERVLVRLIEAYLDREERKR